MSAVCLHCLAHDALLISHVTCITIHDSKTAFIWGCNCSLRIQDVTVVQCHIHIGKLRKDPPRFLLLESVGLALAEILLDGASNGAVSGELLSNCTLR